MFAVYVSVYIEMPVVACRLHWNLSIYIKGTIANQLSVLCREVSLIQMSWFVHSSVWLGLQTVSSLNRCSLYSVSFIERFRCSSYFQWHICSSTVSTYLCNCRLRNFELVNILH